MATGHIRKRIGTNGATSYQITAEADRDPLTGKRERRYKTIKGTKKQAEAELRKMISDLESGNTITMSAMKLSAWMDTWLTTYLPNIEETTRDGYQEKIENYNIQQWILDLRKRGLSPKTIRNAYNNLNAALKKAVVLQMIPHNPCEGTELPKLEKYQAQVYNITTMQSALALADSLSMYLIILLGATVGLRRGEMAALRWDDIDFSTETLSVVQNRVHAKKAVVQKAPKSKAGYRTITLCHDVADALRMAKVSYDRAATKPSFHDLGYVLCKENGHPFHPDSITQKWERFVAKHNLPKIRLHDLRHSNATAMIASGISAKVVQHRLGHSDVSITLNTYTHVLPEMDQDAADKLNQSLSTGSQPITQYPMIF